MILRRRDLLLAGGALALSGRVAAECRQDRRDRRLNRLRDDCGAAADVVPPIPSGAIIALTAADISGNNMDAVASWNNTGTIADFEQGVTYAIPKLLKNSAEQAVNFDGVFDLLTSPGSAADTGFVMSTGVFDLVLCLRRNNCITVDSRRVCGNAEGQAGIAVLFNGDNDVWVLLGNGSGLINNFTTTITPALGQPMKLLIRGDGTQLRVSTDFSTFEDQAFGAAFGTGSAFYDWSIGGSNPSQTTPKTMEADIFSHYLYDRNLSVAELAAIQANLVAQVGTGI